MPPNTAPRVLYWFRTDLRITDSPALTKALSLLPSTFIPVWCWDPSYIYGHRVGLNRWNFLLESMSDLSSALTNINPKQKLHVVRGRPEQVLPILVKQWGITHVVWEKDSNAYAKIRDKAVREVLGAEVEIVDVPGRHLFDPDEVIKKNKGKPTMTLNQWQKVILLALGDVLEPAPTPTSLPDPGDTKLSVEDSQWKFVWDKVDFNADIRTGTDTCFDKLCGPNNDFAVPTMAEMGYGEATTTIHGGTTEAHKCLDNFLSDSLFVATFSKPKTAPTSLEPATTLLSPYMKFGCIGVREIWRGSKKVISEWKKKGSKGGKETKEPENMFGQLEFRDMYACAEAASENFQQMRGNAACRFIDWKLQNQYDDDGNEILPRPKEDEVDEERLVAWREGRTGFPWIDACMRQLKIQGWIHHLARHSVACFITRGQCYISWERGMEVFDEWLIDWDPSSNPGNWMWLSCSAFFAQYFRVYGLESWPMKTDKSGELVRKYCPELKDFPDKYIYAPHKAPLDVQRKAHCIIGEQYPFPMLDEHKEKDRCIARIKNSFHLGFHGNSPEVLDGTAKQLLKEEHERTGVNEVAEKTDKVKKEEKGTKKREREGNQSLDKFVKKTKVEEDPEELVKVEEATAEEKPKSAVGKNPNPIKGKGKAKAK